MTVPGDNPPPSKPESAVAPPGLESPVEKAVESPAKSARVIKRYSNRKLYDTQSSKYVTLEEIAHMIKAGEELAIIDNKTKDDLTAVTLTQIIYEEEKRKSRMPLGMLRQLITSSGDALQDFFDKSVVQPVTEIRDTANRGVTEIKQGALSLREVATRSVTELTGRARGVFVRSEADVEKKVEETMKGFEESLEELKKRASAQARQVETEGARLAERMVERLEERVAELQQTIAQLKTAAQNHRAAPQGETPALPPETTDES